MDLELLAVGVVAVCEFRYDVRLAGGSQQSRQPILLREDGVDRRAGFDHARPAYDHRYTEAAFPGRALFTLERHRPTVGPADDFAAIVGAVDEDRVVGDAEIIQLFHRLAY